jgi:hypothetical protein
MVKKRRREQEEDDYILTDRFINRIIYLTDDDEIEAEEVYELRIVNGRAELRPWRGEEFVVAGIRI